MISKIEAGKQKGFFGLKNLTITPIQRIPRYRMLLAELLKRTDAAGKSLSGLFMRTFMCLNWSYQMSGV